MNNPTSSTLYRLTRVGLRVFQSAAAVTLVLSVSAQSLVAQVEGAVSESAEPIVQLARLVRWGGVATSVVVIIVVYFGLRFVDSIVEGLGETFTDRRLTLQKFATFLRFGTYITTFMIVFFLSFEVDSRLLTLMGGTAAVALGFALKDLVASVVAGIMIMIDRPFQVGDRVEFGGEYGDITSIGLRSVRLQTLSDNTVTIPNNKLLTDLTSSGNYGALDMMIAIDFHVGIHEDLEFAGHLIRQATATSRYVYLPKPISITVKQVIIDSYVAVRLTVKAYVMDTQYEKAFETDVTLRVLRTFREHGIRPPAVLHQNVEDGALIVRAAS